MTAFGSIYLNDISYRYISQGLQQTCRRRARANRASEDESSRGAPAFTRADRGRRGREEGIALRQDPHGAQDFMVTLVARYVGGGELGPTEIPQLLDRLRNLRLDELRLTDSTETLAEQRLDRLDAAP